MCIVSLLPSATEMLFAIGAGDEVVAVTHECDHPAAARLLPVVTRNLLDSGSRLAVELRERLAAVDAMAPPSAPPATVCIEWTDPIMAGGAAG